MERERRATVPSEIGVPSVDTQCETGEDVGCEGKGDEEGFEGE
jgi:hypothetical protein